jgi:hypothetical protein
MRIDAASTQLGFGSLCHQLMRIVGRIKIRMIFGSGMVPQPAEVSPPLSIRPR